MAINLTSERELHDKLIKEMPNQLSFVPNVSSHVNRNTFSQTQFFTISPFPENAPKARADIRHLKSPGMSAITANRPVTACQGVTNI